MEHDIVSIQKRISAKYGQAATVAVIVEPGRIFAVVDIGDVEIGYCEASTVADALAAVEAAAANT